MKVNELQQIVIKKDTGELLISKMEEIEMTEINPNSDCAVAAAPRMAQVTGLKYYPRSRKLVVSLEELADPNHLTVSCLSNDEG